MDQDDDKRDELNEFILDGGRYEEQVDLRTSLRHRPDVRAWPSLSSWLVAKSDRGGGYRVRGLRSVTWDGVMEESSSPAAIRTFDNRSLENAC